MVRSSTDDDSDQMCFEAWGTSYHIAFLLMSFASVVCSIILIALIKMVPYRGYVKMKPFASALPSKHMRHRQEANNEDGKRSDWPESDFQLWVVKDTIMDVESVVTSISDYCSIRGATTQTLLTAFGNIFSCFGIQASICKLCDSDTSSSDINAIFYLIFGLLGTMALVNLEVNNQTTNSEAVRKIKLAFHLVGCFAFVTLAPYGDCLYSGWNVVSTIFLIVSYLSFFIYLVGRGLTILNRRCFKDPGYKWLDDYIDLSNELAQSDNYGGLNNKTFDQRKNKNDEESPLLATNSSSANNDSNDRNDRNDNYNNYHNESGMIMRLKNCGKSLGALFAEKERRARPPEIDGRTFKEKEKHRRCCSYFFCITELLAVAGAGAASLHFIYQM